MSDASDSRALTPLRLLVFSAAAGLAVANVYAAQPLLASIVRTFAAPNASAGWIVALTQAGYALGLAFVAPLADRVQPRLIAPSLFLGGAAALTASAMAPTFGLLLAGMFGIGLTAVVVQVLVGAAARFADSERRGRAVGVVTSGVVIGILASRAAAGALAGTAGWRAVYASAAVMMLVAAALLRVITPAAPTGGHLAKPVALLGAAPRLLWEDATLRRHGVLAFFLFASFSTLWSSLSLPLSAPPFNLSSGQIGAFGLAGLAGAAAAAGAGQLADRRLGQRVIGWSFVVLAGSWLLVDRLEAPFVSLIGGIVLLDFAVQAVHVSNQTALLARRPESANTLVAGYMLFYAAGSGLGAAAATTAFSLGGWRSVTLLGAAFALLGLGVWIIGRPKSAEAPLAGRR